MRKHHSDAKLQKLRCSQQSALHIAKSSYACGTSCVFRSSYLQAVQLQQNLPWIREQRRMLWDKNQTDVSSLQAGYTALAAMD